MGEENQESGGGPSLRGPSLVGAALGRYLLVRLLGVGGMGSVYEATHQDLGRRAAIKTLHERYGSEHEARQRFLQEGQAAARIRHPNVADVYDVGIIGTGRCLEHFGTAEAYLPFLEALGAWLAGDDAELVAEALKTHAPSWCLQFPAVFGTGETHERLKRLTEGATRERMLRELAAALGALAAKLPVLLRLEDLHWADPASVDLLRLLCQRVKHEALLVLGTFRPDQVDCTVTPRRSCHCRQRGRRKPALRLPRLTRRARGVRGSALPRYGRERRHLELPRRLSPWATASSCCSPGRCPCRKPA